MTTTQPGLHEGAAEVLRRRLATQRLVGPGLDTATEVVSLLTCVQSQEWAHGFWSLGMRSGGLGYDDVRREFDEGRFLRTHVLRPTWHFLTAADVRWILRLTSPRVQQANRGRYRQLDLTQADLDRGTDIVVAALRGGVCLTRPELAATFQAAGLSSEGQRLVYLLMNAELEGVICSGPMRGAQHTYALLEERVPAAAAAAVDQPLAELVRRFFSGHGPAGVKDFTRWSSLTTADTQSGLAQLDGRLESLEVAGQTLWFDPGQPAAPADVNRALLVPLYDEVTLSYPRLGFPPAPGHPHPPGTDLFIGSVLVDTANVGTWRRTVKGSTVLVEVALAPGLGDPQRAAVAEAVGRLAAFLGKTLSVSWT